ncbi:MAG: ATP-binding protein [Solirubrobacterales bacterium]
MAYLLLLALIAFGVPLAVSLGKRVDSEVKAQARSQANLVAASAQEGIEPSPQPALQRLVEASASAQRGRVIVVDAAGRVIADSAGPAEIGGDYASRPEIATALQGRSYQETRNSSTLGADILATAVPVDHDGTTIGAVRVTQSVTAVSRATRNAILELALLGGVVLLLGVVGGALVARETARPITDLEQTARRVEGGDLTATAPLEGSSEQRALARAFNRMTERLARTLRGHRDFVADASHQLRTPLTGIRLRLEELREEIPDTDRRAAELDAGLAEVDRLSQIVDELLILSRAGERELPGERIDVAAAVDRTCERWRKTAGEARVELVRERRGDAGKCFCAPTDFDRVLDALIENAVRYSPPGSEVHVVTAADRIEVLDEGPGLEPGEEEQIFERFHRGSAGRRGAKGSGLGLPIARELAGQWGGTVSLENRPGTGGRAVLRLPGGERARLS